MTESENCIIVIDWMTCPADARPQLREMVGALSGGRELLALDRRFAVIVFAGAGVGLLAATDDDGTALAVIDATQNRLAEEQPDCGYVHILAFCDEALQREVATLTGCGSLQ